MRRPGKPQNCMLLTFQSEGSSAMVSKAHVDPQKWRNWIEKPGLLRRGPTHYKYILVVNGNETDIWTRNSDGSYRRDPGRPAIDITG